MAARAGSDAPTLLGRGKECEILDRLLAGVHDGTSQVLVLRGDAGAGKSALLAYVSDQVDGWRVATAVGVESEMELAFSGLQELCAPMLDQLERLPGPQRDALATVFGLSAGPAPDRFLVGLATLTLLAEAAEQRPLLCIVEDAQWLDGASAQIVAFVARRLLAERIAFICAARTGIGDHVLAGLPELAIGGLRESDARALLLGNVHGPLDAALCDQMVAESHGIPLALLELPRTWTGTDLAGGFGLPGSQQVAGRIEQSYSRRLLQLPDDTRVLLLAAAAEPLGDTGLLHRAVEALGLDMAAAGPAIDAGLFTVGGRVTFAHPLLRSAAYRSATTKDRRRIHGILADLTNAETDPDRRAWHLACATPAQDEEVAAELERSADRAQARGGLGAAASFLERAAELSGDPARRLDRALAAAEASVQAGAFDAALRQTAVAETVALDELQRARIALVRARVAFASGLGSDAPPLLLAAAGRIKPFDADLARDTYLDAWQAAFFAGELASEGNTREVSKAAKALPAPTRAPSGPDLLLDGLAALATDGYAAAAPTLREAANAFATEGRAEDNFRWGWLPWMPANVLWDDLTWHAITDRQLRRGREVGALARLPIDLTSMSMIMTWWGDFAGAESAVAEAAMVADATGAPFPSYGALFLAAWRGREAQARPLIEATIAQGTTGGQGISVQVARWFEAVLFNGVARYDEALRSAVEACRAEFDVVSAWALPELIEASVKSRQPEVGRDALERLAEVAGVAGTDWVLGIESRCRALLSDGKAAEELYREAVDELGRTHFRPELARTHLLYGEWLRREGRRVDAREQLRPALELLQEIGMEAFAERARIELLATGEKVRKRVDETRGDLTPQEIQIARLARDGLSNPEIGTRLFLSPRTVEWHLRKVFTKLGINSRRQLRVALPESSALLANA